MSVDADIKMDGRKFSYTETSQQVLMPLTSPPMVRSSASIKRKRRINSRCETLPTVCYWQFVSRTNKRKQTMERCMVIRQVLKNSLSSIDMKMQPDSAFLAMMCY